MSLKTLADLHNLLHHEIEVASNCAGPDGAKDAVKRAVSKVIAKVKELGLELLPIAEKTVDGAVDVGLQAVKPVVEEKLGEPIASVVEAGVESAVTEGLHVAEQSVGQSLDASESAVTENK